METLQLELPENGVMLVKLNRPERLNAISETMVNELHALLDDLEEDRQTHVVVLSGSGRAFCSGTDLKAASDASASPETPDVSEVSYRQRRLSDLVLKMRKVPQPIIAAVNGPAAGGGFCFTMAADIRLAAESAYFVASFINVGLTGGDVGSTYFLPRLIGLSSAAELLYTGGKLSADEALRVGYVSRVVPDGDLIPAALETARIMLDKSSFGLRMTKELLNHSIDASSLEAALYMENRSQSLAVLGGGFHEAARKFSEKK